MGGALSFFGTSSVDSVTGGAGSKGSSSEGSDVRRTPRPVVGAVVIQEVGFLVEDEGENSRSESDVLKETPRLVVRSFLFLILEETGFDGHSGDSGDQMEVPSVVV